MASGPPDPSAFCSARHRRTPPPRCAPRRLEMSVACSVLRLDRSFVRASEKMFETPFSKNWRTRVTRCPARRNPLASHPAGPTVPSRLAMRRPNRPARGVSVFWTRQVFLRRTLFLCQRTTSNIRLIAYLLRRTIYLQRYLPSSKRPPSSKNVSSSKNPPIFVFRSEIVNSQLRFSESKIGSKMAIGPVAAFE